jgi:hypothetical protein
VFAYSPASDGTSGYTVITDRFVCLLGPNASADLARSVFWLLDGEDAQLDDALGTLAHVESVDRFAIVEVLDRETGTMTIAVRGEVHVRIHGTTTTRPSAPGAASWITTEASGVDSLHLALDNGETGGELLPLQRGVARTNAVVAEPVADFRFTGVDEQSVIPERLDEVTELELTVDPTGSRTGWILRLPDGHELSADGTIVIGRAAWDDETGDDLVKHVSVPSPRRQISGAHLELALVGGELVARDLDSTNGTIVLTPERAPRLLHGGDTTSLQAGDILDLGESFRIVVSNKH